MASSTPVTRITLFKLPSVEDQKLAVRGYEELVKTNSKDGKPYILSIECGPAEADARNNGFNFVAKTTFKDKADFDYYDTECAAHKKFKELLKGADLQGMMMVYYIPAVTTL